MNWQTFQTHNQSPEKAFESLCNQLFENWARQEYLNDILYFTVVNGAGGDGGIESYTVLQNGDIIGLQAKWFPNVITDSHISQIRNSIKTALNIRPELKKYIVCVPRNLSPQTGRSKNCEENRWLSLVCEIKKDFPNLDLILWNESRIETELQKESSLGILKYWFKNSKLSYETLIYSFEKSKNSWLSNKYTPELNCYGKIYNTLTNLVGSRENRREIYKTFAKIKTIAKEFDTHADNLIVIIKDNTEDSHELKNYIDNTKTTIAKLIFNIDKILEQLQNDTITTLEIDYDIFNNDFEYIAETIRKNNVLYNHYLHISNVTKILKKLSSFNFYALLDKLRLTNQTQNIIFKGEPGTGKTHGVSAFIDNILKEKYHAGLIIQARDIESSKTWKDIVLSNLGLGYDWEEDELWQALSSMVNTNKLSELNLNDNFKMTPQVVIIVDAIDESSTHEKWLERVKESTVISEKYPQIKFCFSTRPYVFETKIDKVKMEYLSINGDVSIVKLFDDYIKHFNIKVKNSNLLKYSLTTPLSLKLFCELNQNKAIDFNDSYDVSLPALLNKKIDVIEQEFSKNKSIDIKNQYILKSIKTLTELFFNNTSLEHSELISQLSQNIGADTTLASSIIEHLNNYGLLNCYCKQGNTLFDYKTYHYSTGIRGYFDHASSILILEKYENPEVIDFKEYPCLHINTLYDLAIISIRNHGYLITQNSTLGEIIDDDSLAEIQYWALIHSPINIAKKFEEPILKSMKQSSTLLHTAVNRIILPLSRQPQHPLGVDLLDKVLNEFDSPARRDIFWAPTGYLRNSFEKIWNRNVSLELDNETYKLNKQDLFNGCPTIYAWALSSLNNSLRLDYRNELMKWANQNPMEFFKLFEKFVIVDDKQILGDLLSILMCLIYQTNDLELTQNSLKIITEKLLSKETVDKNRSITIRYYSIAIIYKAIELDICNKDEAIKFLPPYSVDNNNIKINKEALNGSRMGGYSGISYDLSRYVLIDHIESHFNSYKCHNKQKIDNLLTEISKINDIDKLDFEHFVLSAAFAYINDMGWNEKDFYNYERTGINNEIIGGIDCSILSTHYPASHGSKSNVMTVCEKYVWLARDYILGYLCDRLPYNDTLDFIVDYGLLQDFIIPAQELKQIDPNNIPEENPWHIPEQEKVIINTKTTKSDDVIEQVEKNYNIDWQKWIFLNANHNYNIPSGIIALKNDTSFHCENVHTFLSINSLIVEKTKLDEFIKHMSTEDNFSRLNYPDALSGGVESNCYITPIEMCWFNWKKHHEPYETEEFTSLNILCTTDKGCWNHEIFGDIYFYMPSPYIRSLLEINSTNGYTYSNKTNMICAEYCIAGELHNSYQDIVWAANNILSLLENEEKTIIWIMKEYRRESGISREKYGDFYVEKDNLYIGYLDKDKNFISQSLNNKTDKKPIK